MERDLGSPYQLCWQPTAQAIEQSHVRGVANGIVRWVQPKARTKANGARRPCDLLDRDTSQLGPFDPAELAARHSCRGRGVVLAQAGLIAAEKDLPSGFNGQLP